MDRVSAAHAYEKPKKADDHRNPKEEPEIIFAPCVVYFVHLNVRIKEGEDQGDRGYDPMP
jgi:hypothetical protein